MSDTGTPDAPRDPVSPGEAPAGTDDTGLSDDQRDQLSQAAEQVAAIRAQLAATPVELVVANHVMGLYELAAVHLDQAQPNLGSARLAIDALGAILDACKGRLGENEATLVGARSQLQLAYVAVSGRAGGAPGDGEPRPEPGAAAGPGEASAES